IAANLALKGYREPHASRGPLLRLRRMRERALELIAHYRIAAPGPSAPARLLSGGNLQKVVLAREFSGRPRLLIAAAPTRRLLVAVPAGSLVFAFFASGLVLLATGHDAVSSYRQIVDAAFLNSGALGQTLTQATPLAFTGLAAAAAFRMRLFNIGAEGQLFMGAIAADAAGLFLGGHGWPTAVVIFAMVVAGCTGGAAWALIPGLLRAFFKTNEIITSLMLNYVAAYVLTYLIFNTESYWRETKGFNASVFPTSKTLPDAAVWPAANIFPLGAGIAV